MIRIHKPPAPAILRDEGQREARRLCAAYEADPGPFLRGEVTFDRDIYAHATVKEALLDAQHGKCAFCESRVRHIAHGDVEHYRPKAGVIQRARDPLTRPGYYWLAYEWDNLFFCCPVCNQSFKRNLFPLRNPRQRARSHNDDITREQRLLIHPGWDEPEDFVGFHDFTPYPLRNRSEGRVTIDVVGLGRAELADQRRFHFDRVHLIVRAHAQARRVQRSRPLTVAQATLLTDMETELAALQLDSAEYAAMTRALLTTHPPR